MLFVFWRMRERERKAERKRERECVSHSRAITFAIAFYLITLPNITMSREVEHSRDEAGGDDVALSHT